MRDDLLKENPAKIFSFVQKLVVWHVVLLGCLSGASTLHAAPHYKPGHTLEVSSRKLFKKRSERRKVSFSVFEQKIRPRFRKNRALLTLPRDNGLQGDLVISQKNKRGRRRRKSAGQALITLPLKIDVAIATLFEEGVNRTVQQGGSLTLSPLELPQTQQQLVRGTFGRHKVGLIWDGSSVTTLFPPEIEPTTDTLRFSLESSKVSVVLYELTVTVVPNDGLVFNAPASDRDPHLFSTRNSKGQVAHFFGVGDDSSGLLKTVELEGSEGSTFFEFNPAGQLTKVQFPDMSDLRLFHNLNNGSVSAYFRKPGGEMILQSQFSLPIMRGLSQTTLSPPQFSGRTKEREILQPALPPASRVRVSATALGGLCPLTGALISAQPFDAHARAAGTARPRVPLTETGLGRYEGVVSSYELNLQSVEEFKSAVYCDTRFAALTTYCHNLTRATLDIACKEVGALAAAAATSASAGTFAPAALEGGQIIASLCSTAESSLAEQVCMEAQKVRSGREMCERMNLQYWEPPEVIALQAEAHVPGDLRATSYQSNTIAFNPKETEIVELSLDANPLFIGTRNACGGEYFFEITWDNSDYELFPSVLDQYTNIATKDKPYDIPGGVFTLDQTARRSTFSANSYEARSWFEASVTYFQSFDTPPERENLGTRIVLTVYFDGEQLGSFVRDVTSEGLSASFPTFLMNGTMLLSE